MKLLLDTHVFLWLVAGDSRLSAVAKNALGDPVNELLFSVASVWELAIKTASKKLVLSDPLDAYLTKWTTAYQVNLLPIAARHALWTSSLPDHHRDPFDRLIIAHALVEGFTLVTADPKLASYAVPILW